MHPILFVLETDRGSRPFATFGVLLALGMLVASFVGIRATTRAGIPWSDGLAATSILASSGLFGGYALQVVVETLRGASFTDAARAGGLTFYGAPVVGTLVLALAAKPLGLPFLRFVDAGIVGVPFAHAIGRMGCFFAGCCYGSRSDGPLAVTFTHPFAAASVEPIPRHPVQLYESLALLVLALVYVMRPPRFVGDGRRAVSYAAAYAIVRLVMERFRGDAERGFIAGSISTSDGISLAVLVLALAYERFAPRRDERAA